MPADRSCSARARRESPQEVRQPPIVPTAFRSIPALWPPRRARRVGGASSRPSPLRRRVAAHLPTGAAVAIAFALERPLLRHLDLQPVLRVERLGAAAHAVVWQAVPVGHL